MSRKQFPPVFATNVFADGESDGETVAEKLNLLLRTTREQLAEAPALAIATAYLNTGGFGLLADELERAPRVRLLLGAEPNASTGRRLDDSLEPDEVADLVQSHSQWLARERDLTGFTRQEDASAHRLVDWLSDLDEAGLPRVEVRRYGKGFLHGKAYIVDHPTFAHTLAGSSNFTYAGLARNAELNLGYPSTEHTHLVQAWFERLWDESDPYDLAGLYKARWEPHSPWLVFLRMLWELYGDTSEDDRFQSQMGLTSFQREGVARMIRLMEAHGGVLVADEVGLGKTFMAGEVIRRATEENRQRVLIVTPAPLKSGMWEPFLDKYDFSRRVKVYSYEELRNRWLDDPNGDLRRELDEYALVVIDEAHNLRNPNAQRSEVIAALVGGAHPKQVLLLTATPVNNSLLDLHVLIRYFIRNDARFAEIGIPSIKKHIERAQALDPESLSPEHLFDLIDQVAVRRTRRFIKTHYAGDSIPGDDGVATTIVFPTPELKRLDYELSDASLDLLNAVTYALDSPDDTTGYGERQEDSGRLMLARYIPSAYTKDSSLAEAYQIANAGLLRMGLLKRLESSPAAIAATLGTLIRAHEAFIAALAEGWVITGEALRDWTSSESEDLDDFIEGLDEKLHRSVERVDGYHYAHLASDVSEDLAILHRLKAMADTANATLDPKAERLIERLREIAKDARVSSSDGVPGEDRRKTIVFSTYTDTVIDLHKEIASVIESAASDDPVRDFRGRIAAPIYGSKTGIDQEGRARTLAGFAPETAGTPGSQSRFDLLFTTDVLSEGVNLQQAGRIINYDLPWNPMRVVQRHGRIDRIGSKHPRVFLDCFFPAVHLDKFLELEAKLHRKLAQADAALGVGEVLPGFAGSEARVFADTHDQIRQLAAEDASILDSGPGALSGEEYRRRLRKATQPSTLSEEVVGLPWGAGSGYKSQTIRTNGFVFCARIEGVDKPIFRFVGVDSDWRVISDDEGNTLLDRETLTALSAADPGSESTGRHLTPEAYDGAFDAWAVARDDIHSEWNRLSDPAALQPKLPKAMREARDLVADHGEFLGNERQQNLYQRLGSVPPPRVERSLREILNSDIDARAKVQAVDVLAEAEGLEVPPPPPVIEPVATDQIHLVTWMAVAQSDELDRSQP